MLSLYYTWYTTKQYNYLESTTVIAMEICKWAILIKVKKQYRIDRSEWWDFFLLHVYCKLLKTHFFSTLTETKFICSYVLKLGNCSCVCWNGCEGEKTMFSLIFVLFCWVTFVSCFYFNIFKDVNVYNFSIYLLGNHIFEIFALNC